MTKNAERHLYSLNLKKELFDEINNLAANEGCSFLELVTKFIKIGMFVYKETLQGSGVKIITQEGKETNYIII